jgi:hypothetical protein
MFHNSSAASTSFFVHFSELFMWVLHEWLSTNVTGKGRIKVMAHFPMAVQRRILTNLVLSRRIFLDLHFIFWWVDVSRGLVLELCFHVSDKV